MVRVVQTLCWFLGVASTAWVSAAAPRSAREIFDPGRAHKIEIRMSAEGWELLQPGAAAQKAASATNRAEAKALRQVQPGYAATAYAYVPSEIKLDGKRVPDVGVRFKGNSSYSVSATTLRRPFKLDFDRFVEGRRFAGVESLNLSNT